MVSAEYYIKTFQAVFPKRVEELRRFIIYKNQINNKSKQANSLAEEDRKRLIEIMGNDTFFRSGKNKPKTLRHRAFKLKKSLQFFCGSKKKLEELFGKSANPKTLIITKIHLEEIDEMAESMIDALERLEAAYSMQIHWLNISEVRPDAYNEYIQYVNEEKRILLSLTPFRAEINSIVKAVNYRWSKIADRILGENFRDVGAAVFPLAIVVLGLFIAIVYSFVTENVYRPSTKLEEILAVLGSSAAVFTAVWGLPIVKDTIKAIINAAVEE